MVKRFQLVTKHPQDALQKLMTADIKASKVAKLVEFVRKVETHTKNAETINKKISAKIAANDEEAKKEWFDYLNEDVEISPLLPADIASEVPKLSAVDYMSLEQLVEGGVLMMATEKPGKAKPLKLA